MDILDWLEAVAQAQDMAAGGKPQVERIERTAAILQHAKARPNWSAWSRNTAKICTGSSTRFSRSSTSSNALAAKEE